MRKFVYRKIVLLVTFAALTLSAANVINAQVAEPTPKPAAPSTIFRDSDGKLISNNEFVDIRMANFHYKDQTLTKILDDGTIEFRLQKIPQEGMTAPNFTAKDINGEPINFRDLKGKVVVLNFWFIGCPACIAETPKLNQLAENFADVDDVVFIALTYEPTGKVKHYLSREKFNYRVAGDAQPALDMFVFSGYPKNIVIGRDGKIVYWRSPIHAWDKFESVIKTELLKTE